MLTTHGNVLHPCGSATATHSRGAPMHARVCCGRAKRNLRSMPTTHRNALHPNASAKIHVAPMRVSVSAVTFRRVQLRLLRARRVRVQARRTIVTLEKRNLTTAWIP